VSVRDAHARDMTSVDLYRVLALRSQVFVVEQDCVYHDPDGRDLEDGVRQLWIDADDGAVAATARLLPEPGGGTRIGRVVTAPASRGLGLAGRLLDHALATSDGPWVLDAQAHLADWYAGFGFAVCGEGFLDDGIPHVPMHRPVADR
jgi:ElaA protein